MNAVIAFQKSRGQFLELFSGSIRFCDKNIAGATRAFSASSGNASTPKADITTIRRHVRL
jgi:hypothetical protein